MKIEIDDEVLKEVIWSVCLSDHMGDVSSAIEPILNVMGLPTVLTFDELIEVIRKRKLQPTHALEDEEQSPQEPKKEGSPI